MKKTLFTLGVIALMLISACQKFDLNSKMSFRTKNNRLIGYWQKTVKDGYVNYSYLNGDTWEIDSTIRKQKILYHFRDDGNFSYIYSGYFYIPNNTLRNEYNINDSIIINDTLFLYNEYYNTGNWNWLKNDISLLLDFGNDSIRWDILMLTDEELRAEIDPSAKIKLFKCEVSVSEDYDFPFK